MALEMYLNIHDEIQNSIYLITFLKYNVAQEYNTLCAT